MLNSFAWDQKGLKCFRLPITHDQNWHFLTSYSICRKFSRRTEKSIVYRDYRDLFWVAGSRHTMVGVAFPTATNAVGAPRSKRYMTNFVCFDLLRTWQDGASNRLSHSAFLSLFKCHWFSKRHFILLFLLFISFSTIACIGKEYLISRVLYLPLFNLTFQWGCQFIWLLGARTETALHPSFGWAGADTALCPFRLRPYRLSRPCPSKG